MNNLKFNGKRRIATVKLISLYHIERKSFRKSKSFLFRTQSDIEKKTSTTFIQTRFRFVNNLFDRKFLTIALCPKFLLRLDPNADG